MRWIALIGGLALAAGAQAAELRDLHLLESPEGTRAVFELDAAAQPTVFSLAHPDRLVVDFDGVDPASAKRLDDAGRGLVKAVRSGPRDHGLRVVFDLGAPVSSKSFSLQPVGPHGYRVIVDLTRVGAKPPLPAAIPLIGGQEVARAVPAAPKPDPAIAEAAPRPVPVAPAAIKPAVGTTTPMAYPAVGITRKPIVVAVDAGHGGVDPGAHGPTGLQEKTVTLAIAKRLAALIDAQPGMRAVLTRSDDTFVELRERTRRARQAQADLFVSIHANANPNHDMRGTAVYVLSDRGASSEQARWLANHENAADLVGGVKLSNKTDDLAAVLIDISQSATMEASFDLGDRLLSSLGQVNRLLRPEVQQAGFMVLKSPDIPSVLVETAFITNPTEERELRTGTYQEKLAQAIFSGIKGYFARYRPVEQQVATSRPVSDSVRSAHAHPVPVNLTRVVR